MRIQRLVGTIPLLVITACSGEVSPISGDVQRSVDGIDPREIRRHIEVLADDRMRGRFPGTEGYRRAADYVAERFAELGLRPAGENGTWYQTVPLLRAELVPDGCRLEIEPAEGSGPVPLVPYVDYYFFADKVHERSDVRAPVAYVGHGVVAPELGYDDFEGVDLRGKIAVLFSGAPEFFPNDERAFHGSWREKARNLVERGAVGLILMSTPEMAERYPFERSVQNARIPSMGWVRSDGGVQDTHPELRFGARFSPAAADRLFEGAPVAIDEVRAAITGGTARAFDLPVVVSARTETRHDRLESPNVLGLLPGGDAALHDEHVLLVSHLDHLGVGTPVEGDSIRNGAYDNASGCAISLEVARAFERLGEPPARSLLFAMVTAEERGLLGSDYFAHHPTVPMESIVACVSLDMVLMLHALNDVTAYGAEHSSLIEPLTRAARRRGIKVTPDPMPEEAIFVRSDQYSLVRQGVPALFLVTGTESGDPEIDGAAMELEWRREVYHTPADDLSQTFVLDAGAEFARLNLLLAYFVANDPVRPAWNEGDFFGRPFGRTESRP